MVGRLKASFPHNSRMLVTNKRNTAGTRNIKSLKHYMSPEKEDAERTHVAQCTVGHDRKTGNETDTTMYYIATTVGGGVCRVGRTYFYFLRYPSPSETKCVLCPCVVFPLFKAPSLPFLALWPTSRQITCCLLCLSDGTLHHLSIEINSSCQIVSST